MELPRERGSIISSISISNRKRCCAYPTLEGNALDFKPSSAGCATHLPRIYFMMISYWWTGTSCQDWSSISNQDNGSQPTQSKVIIRNLHRVSTRGPSSIFLYVCQSIYFPIIMTQKTILSFAKIAVFIWNSWKPAMSPSFTPRSHMPD